MKRLCFCLALIFLLGSLTGCGTTAPIEEPAPAAEESVSAVEEPAPDAQEPASEEPAPEDEGPVPEEEEAEPEVKEPEPETAYLEDFTVDTVDGGTFTLSEELEDHKLVLINLWATWCEPCRKEFPYLQQAWAQRSDEVSVIALSIDPDDTIQRLRSFANGNGLRFPVGNVGETGLDRFSTAVIPTTLVVDHDGRILAAATGVKSSAEEFIEMFDGYMSESFPLDTCTYMIYTYDINLCPVEGVVLNFCTDYGCTAVTSDENGLVEFTGMPARYHVQLLSAPGGRTKYSETELYTEPFAQTFFFFLTEAEG